MGDDPKQPKYLKTIYGEGYRLIAPVTLIVPIATPSIPQTPVRRRRSWLPLCGMGAAAILAFVFRPEPPPPRVIHSLVLTASPQTKLSPLVSNSRDVFFQEKEHYGLRIAEVPVTGGDSLTLPLPVANPDLCAISPDGTTLAIRNIANREREGPFWLLPLRTHRPEPLGQVQGWDITYCPDGSGFFFTAGDSLVRCDSRGAHVRKLATFPGRPYWPRCSPNGKRVSVTVTDRQTQVNRLWEASADGDGAHLILPGWDASRAQCCGSWTPDSDYFIFQASSNGVYQLWAKREGFGILRRINPEPVQLTFGTMAHRGPLASVDGSRIYARTILMHGELVAYDSASQSLRPVLPGVSASMADWSPDGQWIAYTSLPENELWRSRVGGSEPAKLAGDGMQCALPRWSPDGKTIVFMGRQPGKSWQLYLVPAEGGALEPVHPSGENQADPTWSPDGGRICFGRITPMQSSGSAEAVFILDRSSGKLEQVPGSTGYFSPRWSPNGEFIAAIRADGAQIRYYNLKNGEWKVVENGPAGYPHWSLDSQNLYFLSLGSPPQISRVRIATGQIEQVLSLRTLKTPGVIFGDWIGLGPGDRPMAVRDLSLEEIVSLEWQAP